MCIRDSYGAVDGLRSVPVAAGGGEHAHGGFELRDGAVVIASITSCTVSYTHLDVYKRQFDAFPMTHHVECIATFARRT